MAARLEHQVRFLHVTRVDPRVMHPADLSRDSFPRLPDGWLGPRIIADVEAFDARYTSCGRCPADDLLEADILQS